MLMLCRALALESNQLEGPVPFTIGSLGSLSSLTLDHNRLSALPQSTLSLVALRFGPVIAGLVSPYHAGVS